MFLWRLPVDTLGDIYNPVAEKLASANELQSLLFRLFFFSDHLFLTFPSVPLVCSILAFFTFAGTTTDLSTTVT